MKAKDVKVGDKVFVEVERASGVVEAHPCTETKFIARPFSMGCVNFVYFTNDHQVFPGLLGLCRKLLVDLKDQHSLFSYFARKRGEGFSGCTGDDYTCKLIKEADAILGLEKVEGG